jgi:hypothetical protein
MTELKPFLEPLGPSPESRAMDEPYQRGPSTILVQLIEGSHYLFTRDGVDAGIEIEECRYTNGDADIEADAGMLHDAIAPMLEDGFWRVGWFVIERFTCHYSRDYWGECDVDYECTNVREATDEDIATIGVCE